MKGAPAPLTSIGYQNQINIFLYYKYVAMYCELTHLALSLIGSTDRMKKCILYMITW